MTLDPGPGDPGHGPRPDVLDRVRSGAAEVAERAVHVHVATGRLAPYADELVASGELDRVGRVEGADASGPWAVDHPDPEAAVALVLALDAVNFGSGWHPVVRKRPGCSGAVTMATNLREHVDRHGDVTARWLAGIEPSDAHRIFDQPHDGGPVEELMAHFAAALAELGTLVETDHDGSFTALVASAGGSAARLVDVLASLPGFADVWTLDGVEVPILKRAQLAVADLHRTFGPTGPGRFRDLDRLTAFADNLVPHVLRLDGVLVVDEAVVQRIDAEELLAAGSREELEIRAVGLHAVEELRRALAARGHAVPSWQLDQVLWSRGAGARYKARPRHRARSTAY